ncbi:MAG: LamG domain-containing protein, partial [Candidatus Omnitrophica bacterium]|nr:LamG domain-containing protein [Candidatus Omnitrophota bacterium]
MEELNRENSKQDADCSKQKAENSLPTADCQLPTGSRLLPTASCRRPTVFRKFIALGIILAMFAMATFKSWAMWTEPFTTAANYAVSDALKILVNGTYAILIKSGTRIKNDTASGDFSPGTHTDSLTSYQSTKVALNPTNRLPLPFSNGLVSRWKFEGDATDAFGSNPGSLSGGNSYGAGYFGQGVTSNGTSSAHVDVADSASTHITGAITVSAWYKATSFVSFAGIIQKFPETNNGGGFVLGFAHVSQGGIFRFDVSDGATNSIALSTSAAPIGSWHHVAVTYDQINAKYYMDGILDSTTAMTRTLAASTKVMQIAGSGATTAYWNGSVDDVTLWDRALSASEIASLVFTKNVPISTELSGLQSGLVNYWTLENTANDVLGTNNGTEVGSPVYSTAAKVGTYSLSLNGSTQYMSASDAGFPSGSSSRTVSLWVKPKVVSVGSGDQGFVFNYGSNVGQQMFYIGIIQTTNKWIVGQGSVNLTGNTAIAGQWTHLVATSQGSTTTLYENGTMTVSGSLTHNTVLGGTLYLGRYIAAQYQYYNGLIDDVAIWNRPLTADEVWGLYTSKGRYKAPNPTGGGQGDGGAAAPSWGVTRHTKSLPWGEPLEKPPVGYWKFDEGTGNPADFSGNALNGTLVNSPTWSGSVPTVAFSDTNSLTFNGSSNFVKISNSALIDSMSSKATVAAWLKTTATTVANVVSSYDGTNGYQLNLNSSGYPTIWSNSGGDLTYSTTVSDGNWHHLAGAWDGTNAFLYVDGIQKASGARTFSNSTKENQIGAQCTGASSTTCSNYYNGSVDEVAIYDYPLTPAEIGLLASGKKRSRVQKTEYPNVPASSAEDYEKNLVALWHLDSDTNDSAGTNVGTVNGSMGYSNGIAGPGGDFNGTDAWISIADSASINLTGSFSISSWVNANSFANNVEEIYARSQPGGGASGFSFEKTGGANTVSFWMGTSGTWGSVASSTLSTNTWYHLVGTYDGTNMKFYTNGVLNATTAHAAIPSLAIAAGIGRHPTITDADRYWKGRIDEVALFNIGLTAAQIADIYQRGAGKIKHQVRTASVSGMTTNVSSWSGGGVPDKGPVGVWHLNEGTGTNAADSAGTNTGTLTNSPSWVTGKIGGALSFNGSSQYVNVP